MFFPWCDKTGSHTQDYELTKEIVTLPIPLTSRPNAWVCGCSLAGIGGSNLARAHGCLSLVTVVCYPVEVPASGWSPEQRGLSERGVSEYVRETPTMRRSWSTEGGWWWCDIRKYVNLSLGLRDIITSCSGYANMEFRLLQNMAILVQWCW